MLVGQQRMAAPSASEALVAVTLLLIAHAALHSLFPACLSHVCYLQKYSNVKFLEVAKLPPCTAILEEDEIL
jgi:hypothetical protein